MNNKIKIEPDHERIEMLEQAVVDFRMFFEAEGGVKKAFKVLKHQFKSYYFVVPPGWRVGLRTLNWQKRMVPDFMSTGSIRSGTSYISAYILQHPAIVLPLTKELATHLPRESFVRAQFPTLKEKAKVEKKYGVAMTADCTPIGPTISFPYWAKAVSPDMKIVLTLRNPVDRAISHFRWNAMITGLFDKDNLWQHMPEFKEAMRIEMKDIPRGGTGFFLFSGSGGTSYLRHSIYLPFVERMHELFGRDKVKIVNANQFFKDPISQMQEIYDFVGLPEYEPLEIKEKNPSPPLEVDDEIRAELVEFFKPYNEQLYDYLGVDFGWQ